MNPDDIKQHTAETIAALINDGADAEQEYQIEHHIASRDFTKLEKAAVELVKVGYHVDDADEFELDDGQKWFAFAAVATASLDAKLIEQQSLQVAEIAKATGVEYDGWGTFFDDGDFFADDDIDDEE